MISTRKATEIERRQLPHPSALAAYRSIASEAQMTDTVVELAERGRALAPEDRARLVELLLQSLEAPDPGIAEVWHLEIRRRLAAYERGEAILFDADEVIAEAERITR